MIVNSDGTCWQITTSSGLSGEEMEHLLSSRMYRDLVQSLESGGSALYPMSPDESVAEGGAPQRGDFVSMLGVPIASVTKSYGYSCAESHRPAEFTEEDLLHVPSRPRSRLLMRTRFSTRHCRMRSTGALKWKARSGG